MSDMRSKHQILKSVVKVPGYSRDVKHENAGEKGAVSSACRQHNIIATSTVTCLSVLTWKADEGQCEKESDKEAWEVEHLLDDTFKGNITFEDKWSVEDTFLVKWNEKSEMSCFISSN